MINQDLMRGTRGWACFQAYLTFIFYMPLTRTAKAVEQARLEAIKDLKDKDEGGAGERAKKYFLSLDEAEKKRMIIECLEVARIPPDDMIALCAVHVGKNGSAIAASTINNYSISEMAEMIIESTIECSNVSSEVFF